MSDGLLQIRPGAAPRSRQRSQELLREHVSNEFIFAVVGHVGSGTSTVAEQLKAVLTDATRHDHPFEVEILKAREQIESWARARGEKSPSLQSKSIAAAGQLQDWGDKMRAEHGDHASIARRLINVIRLRRARMQGVEDVGNDPVMPDGKHRAYIFDAIRHPAEVYLLRSLYRNAFTLIGVVCDEKVREERIKNKFRDAGQENARDFMDRDAKAPEKYGQRVSDAFHLADVFLDNTENRTIGEPARANKNWDIPDQLSRLIKIITHAEIVRPTMAETAMYEAYGAQMRSACLSRQVGAALVDSHGNLIATGTNEVPRAGGGVYGESFDIPGEDELGESAPDHRCAYWDDGQERGCKNTSTQNEIIEKLVKQINHSKLIPQERMEALRKVLRESPIRELLEFSRAVHAEMDALLTAARKGVTTIGTRMFVTTFPCHYCARHIVSAGVDEAQYIEPYPKSRALDLHADSIAKRATNCQPPSMNGTHVLFVRSRAWHHACTGALFSRIAPSRTMIRAGLRLGYPSGEARGMWNASATCNSRPNCPRMPSSPTPRTEMANHDDIPHLKLVTSSPDSSPSSHRTRSPSCEDVAHLRLVTAMPEPSPCDCEVASREPVTQLSLFPGLVDAPSLLAFLDMSIVSDRAFTRVVQELRPQWLLDLRPVPRFDYGRLNRRQAFRLFSENGVIYLDIAGSLGIRERHDSRWDAGILSRELNDLLVRSSQKLIGPIVVFVDDPSVLLTAKHVLPRTLQPRPKRGWVPRVITVHGERYSLSH